MAKVYGTAGGVVHEQAAYDQYLEDIKPVEKDPADREYVTPAPEEVEPQHDAITYARDIVDNLIVKGDYFVQMLGEHNIDPSDTSSNDYLRLMATITNEYLDQDENKEFFTAIDGGETYHAIRLFGTAPYALRQQQHLEKAEAMGNRDGTNHAKDVMVAFNHTVLQFVEQNPSYKLTDLAAQVEAATTLYDHTAKGYAYNAMLGTAEGVRTEYAFLEAISYRQNPNVSIRHGDDTEDRKGIDYVVGLHGDWGDKELLIDIKSSLTSIKERVSKDTEIHELNGAVFAIKEDGHILYYPGTTEESFFRGTFKLEMGEKIKLRSTILEQLQKIAKLS